MTAPTQPLTRHVAWPKDRKMWAHVVRGQVADLFFNKFRAVELAKHIGNRLHDDCRILARTVIHDKQGRVLDEIDHGKQKKEKDNATD